MFNVDTELRRRELEGRPLRVAVIGAGVTGRMIALQLLTPVPGIRLAVIANRTIDRAFRAYHEAGIESAIRADTPEQIDAIVQKGQHAATNNALAACDASMIDVIVEVTGTIEFGAKISLRGIENHKHVVLVNAELDSTLGPILKGYADREGVVITNTDGDEPGVALTLLRYLKSVGLKPVAAGNLKGMIDHYRTPATQRAFAAKYNQDPVKVTSFADGTKLSMETTIVANSTGFHVGKRGMYGPKCDHVNEIADLLPAEQMLHGGIVDYALGAAPHTGAFVVVHEEHPLKRRELAYYKMGNGPFYVFYTPFHLPHIQLVSTIARAAIWNDPTVAPIGAAVCEVATIAKRNLHAGEILDGVGGFTAYGEIENSVACRQENLLPMGLSEGCRVTRDIKKDEPIPYDAVEIPPRRLIDRLWLEQADMSLVSAQ